MRNLAYIFFHLFMMKYYKYWSGYTISWHQQFFIIIIDQMINFPSQDDELDDTTPFFANERQCNSIFDQYNQNNTQDKNVYNLFNQDTTSQHNQSEISINPRAQQSNLEIPSKMLRVNYNESKNSKRSIIDQLDNYNFRDRISYLQESLHYQNVRSIASEANYENSPERQQLENDYTMENPNRNKENNENKSIIVQSQFDQFQQSKLLKQISLSNSNFFQKIIPKHPQQSSQQKFITFKPKNVSQSKQSKVNMGNSMANRFQLKFNQKNEKDISFGKKITQSEVKEISDTESFRNGLKKEKEMKNFVNAFPGENKKAMDKKQEQEIQKNSIKKDGQNWSFTHNLKFDNKKQIEVVLQKKKQTKIYQNKQTNLLFQEKTPNRQSHTPTNNTEKLPNNMKTTNKGFNFSLNLRKSRVQEKPAQNQQKKKTDENTKIFPQSKSFSFQDKKIVKDQLIEKSLKASENSKNNFDENKEMEKEKKGFSLKEQLMNREKRFTEKFKFQPKKQAEDNDKKSRITLKPSFTLKNLKNEKQLVSSNEKKLELVSEQAKKQKNQNNSAPSTKQILKTNFSSENKLAFKKESKEKEKQSENIEEIDDEKQIKKRNQAFKNVLNKWQQQISELNEEIHEKRRVINYSRLKYTEINTYLNKCNFLLDYTQSHNLSQAILHPQTIRPNRPLSNPTNSQLQPTINQQNQHNNSIHKKIRRRNIEYLA